MKAILKLVATLTVAMCCSFDVTVCLADDTTKEADEAIETLKPCEVCASVRFVDVEREPEKTQVELSKERCDDGDYSSCVLYDALTFSSGEPPEASTKSAFESFKKACDKGDLKRCRDTAELYLYGTGVDKNAEEAARLTRSLCDSGYGPSCFDLGRYAQYGVLGELDDKLALESYTKSCAGGFAGGCEALVEDYTRRLSRNDEKVTEAGYTQMMAHAEKACGLGSAYGCSVMSAVFKNGQQDIVDVDAEKSAIYLGKACSAGNLPACSNLTEMYRKGDGVAKDSVKQFEYSLKLCEHGGARGCALVGTHYSDGDGVGRDIQASIKYETKACEMGFSFSCEIIANYYRDGEYVDQDVDKAIGYFKQACEDNASESCDKTREYIHRTENNIPDENAPIISKEISASIGSVVICSKDYNPDSYSDVCASSYGKTPSGELLFFVKGDEYISINPSSFVIDVLKINGADALRDHEKGINFQFQDSSVTMNEEEESYLPLTITIHEGLALNGSLELRGSVTANFSESVKEVESKSFSVSNVKSFEVGPVSIEGSEFKDLRYGLEYVAKRMNGVTKSEIDILEKMIESKGIAIDELGLNISEEEIQLQDISDQEKFIVNELKSAYERLEQRWSGGGSRLGNYGNFHLDIRSGPRAVKKVILLDGDKEIEGSNSSMGFRSNEDDSSAYLFDKPSSDEVRIKIVYWDDPKVVKINFAVTP